MSVTLRSISDYTGLSLPTISQALNNTGRISPQTRATVLKAAAKLGYRPNGLAQAMKAGRFNTLSLIIGGQSKSHGFGWMPASLMHGIEVEAAQADLAIQVAAVRDEQLADPSAMPRILRQWSSDGLLMNYIVDMPPHMADTLRRTHVPTVYLNVDEPSNCIRPDDHGAAATATQQMLKAGHRRVMYVGTNQGWGHYSQQMRLEGYRQAMQQAGLEPMEALVGDYYALNMSIDIAAAVKAYRPSALLVYNGTGALRAMNTLQGMGLRVPTDVSLVTFTDDWSDASGSQPISAMRLPFIEVGRCAVRRLVQLINDGRSFKAQALPAQWYAGQTFAPHVSNE